jgi:sec-independent protein translocase protein TatA
MLIILAIVALLFGSKQLPKLARSLGSAKAEFEKGIHEGEIATPSADAPPATPLPSDEQVTMTRAELDAKIAEARAQRL